MNIDSIKQKFKSWALWLSIASLIVFCIKQFCNVDIAPVVNELLNYLLPILVAFGIVNNPNDKEHF